MRVNVSLSSNLNVIHQYYIQHWREQSKMAHLLPLLDTLCNKSKAHFEAQADVSLKKKNLANTANVSC